MVIRKVNFSKDTNNGAAYINPNSLKIVDIQSLNSAAQNENIEAASGVLHDRFDNYRYYTGDTTS